MIKKLIPLLILPALISNAQAEQCHQPESKPMISKSLKFTDYNGEDLYLAFDLAFESMEVARGRDKTTAIHMPNGRQYLVSGDVASVKARFDEAAEK